MGTYRGNVGNLMQHWTLCELLTIAGRHSSTLSFIDAHAMAPLARKRRDNDSTFTRVQDRLPGQGSVYEQAWHRLQEENGGYPNSAAFVSEVWKGDFSLLLCEKDPPTAREIEQWLPTISSAANCEDAELFPGDWRKRFADGLPNTPRALTLISFDPNMYDMHGPPKEPKPENMYPCDLETVVSAISSVGRGILLQLSTYSAQHGNSQPAVIASIKPILESRGFELGAAVRTDGNMMSLIFTRGIRWAREIRPLPDQFNAWLRSA